jgi:prolyl-tRNA editing enzyme YbaK/EbsC (Cys-tRNA(Pro) deacylase)
MSIERARAHLAKFGLESKIREFSVSSATVSLAAEALGTEPRRIAKSLSFALGDKAILIIAAGDARIDNRKYREKFGAKAKMLASEDVERLIGHAVGGVCPFGIEEGVEVYLDISLRRFLTVFPAVGTAASAIELTIPELELASSFTEWVDVTSVPE